MPKFLQFIAFLLIPAGVHAGSVYEIEGFVSAFFSDTPSFVGEIGSRNPTRSYQYWDGDNVIGYTLNFDVKREVPASASEIPYLLRAFADAQISAMNGRLLRYETRPLGSNLAAFYTIAYSMEGIDWKKETLLVIVHGRNILWSVQTARGFSSIDGRVLFDKHFGKLTVCGKSIYSERIPICDPR